MATEEEIRTARAIVKKLKKNADSSEPVNQALEFVEDLARQGRNEIEAETWREMSDSEVTRSVYICAEVMADRLANYEGDDSLQYALARELVAVARKLEEAGLEWL